MFSTRLNPTKPPAAHRAILERVGAACRELRPIEDQCAGGAERIDETRAIFEKHGVLQIGVPLAQGGVGDDPLLVALAAERIGREGLRVVRWFAIRAATGAAVRFQTTRGESPNGSLMPQPIEPPEETFDAAPRIAALLGLEEHLWNPTSPELIYELNFKFCVAAGAIGVIADCLETAVTWCGNQIKSGLSDNPLEELDRFETQNRHRQIELHVANTASDLESARAIVYAAAELKSEFDRRPRSDHLRLETGTLVNEALSVAHKALARMFFGIEHGTYGVRPMVDCLPSRHRVFVDTKVCPRDRERGWLLQKQIARYYLFE